MTIDAAQFNYTYESISPTEKQLLDIYRSATRAHWAAGKPQALVVAIEKDGVKMFHVGPSDGPAPETP